MWEQWGEWGPCPEECGNVHQERHRDIATQPQHGGEMCQGVGTEKKPCDPISHLRETMADLKQQITDLQSCDHCVVEGKHFVHCWY